MIDPKLLATALTQKSPSGLPSFTKGQIADLAIKEDSFMGQKIRKAMDMGVTKEQAIKYFAFGSSNGSTEVEQPKQSFFDRFVQPAAQGIVDYGTAPAEAAVGGILKGMSKIPSPTMIGLASEPEVQNLPENLRKSSTTARIAIPTAVGIGTAGLGFLPAAGLTGLASAGSSVVGSGLEVAAGDDVTLGDAAGRAVKEGLISVAADAATLGTFRVAKHLLKPVPMETLVKESKKIVGQIIQGDTKSVLKAQTSLRIIDTTGVKTYPELRQVLENKVTSWAGVQDEILDTVKGTKVLDSLSETFSSGTKSAVSNPTELSLKHLEELYAATGDPKNYVKIQDLIEKAKTGGLTAKEINQIARDYGSEFGEKAFGKTGEALTSVNARLYENTRKAVKETARKLLPDKASKILDEEMSALYDTIRNVKAMEKRVATLANKVETRGMIERASRLVGRGIDKLTFNGLRGFLSSMFPSNVGLKQMNSLQIQERLAKNLLKFDDLVTKMARVSDDRAAGLINRFVTEEITGPDFKANPGSMLDHIPPAQPILQGTKPSVIGENPSIAQLGQNTRNVPLAQPIPTTPLSKIPNTKGKVYHATTPENAPKILKEGLKEGSYFARNADEARVSVSHAIPDPVILEIDVSAIPKGTAFQDPHVPKGVSDFMVKAKIDPKNIRSDITPSQ